MSISDALQEVKVKIDNVYKLLEESGASIPDEKNLDNLQTTIESKPSAETIWAYYNGSDIEDGKRVLLTNVGYTVSGSDTFSPNVRPTIINENGFVIVSNDCYQIVNGVVDESTKTGVTGVYSNDATPFFMLNGSVSVNLASPSTVITKGYVDIYTLNNWARPNSSFSGHAQFLDFGFFDTYYSGSLTFVNEDLTTEEITLTKYTDDIYTYSNSSKFMVGTRDLFYVVHDRGSYEWRFIKFEKVDGDYVATTLKSFNKTRPYSIISKSVLINTKTNIQTDTGYISHILHGTGFVGVEINTQDETQSEFGFYNYPQNVLDVMGDRTIYRIQTFYDGTFSLCLSEGTTLICKFTSSSEIEILQVVEPFIVDGDSTVYYRNFTGTKMFWWQSGKPNAPIESNPYGPYNATKSAVDWLAVPREQNRWNTTVLTGFMTNKTKIDNNRQMIEVRTTTK